MGGGGVPRGGRPNQAAYFVALGGIFVLLVLLCCYFCYFFISKVKELSDRETPSTTPSASQQRGPSSYPVQPVIRESATAMAKLCKQLPAPAVGKSDTVFPTSTSPAALQTDTGCGLAVPPLPAVPALPSAPLVAHGGDKLMPSAAVPNANPTLDVEAAR